MIVYKTCGVCGKTTDENSKGKTDKVHIISIDLNCPTNKLRQEYHYECIEKDIQMTQTQESQS